MQICPGDLLVYSKVLTQRNNFLGTSTIPLIIYCHLCHHFFFPFFFFFFKIYFMQTGRDRRRVWPERQVRPISFINGCEIRSEIRSEDLVVADGRSASRPP